ncbi:MAG: hypothetical protein HY393_02370 [Candidatus Diapherotrites archaeon]|nr:hypothetical protein [Candidatus Diapherotrites archaeon]
MNKLLLGILAVAVLALAIFFFPKSAGYTCGFCGPPPSVQRVEYACTGFLVEVPPVPNCFDCGYTLACVGWVGNEKKCYTGLLLDVVGAVPGSQGNRGEVPCPNS